MTQGLVGPCKAPWTLIEYLDDDDRESFLVLSADRKTIDGGRRETGYGTGEDLVRSKAKYDAAFEGRLGFWRQVVKAINAESAS